MEASREEQQLPPRGHGGEHVANLLQFRAPSFIEKEPGLFFEVLEAQWALRRTTDNATKFYTAIASLPSEVLMAIPKSTRSSNDYDQLKQAATEIFINTKTQEIEELLGDRPLIGRPSSHLRQLQQLGQRLGASEDLVKHKFLQSLPGTLLPALTVASQTCSLSQLGLMADELMAISHNSTINQVTTETTQTPHHQYRKQSSTDFSQIPIGLRPFAPNQKPKYCRAHIYYGNNARSCKPWCIGNRSRHTKMVPTSRPSSPSEN